MILLLLLLLLLLLVVVVIIITTLFQDENIFCTEASLTNGQQFTNDAMLFKK